MTGRKTTTRGFSRAATLMQERIRSAGEKRGFAVARLLTHWSEIAGEEVAAIARPVKVGYGRGGIGATLTLLTTGAQAPMVEMQLPLIRDRVNACYGYNAIARVRVTQTAPTGFAEGQAQFGPAPKSTPREPAPQARAQAHACTDGVHDTALRDALDRLGAQVLSKDVPTRSTT